MTPQDQTRDGRGDAEGLLDRLHAGDADAFEVLVRSHIGRMRAVAVRITGDSDVDDVLQNAFISAFRALPGFRGESRLGTWLHRIAVNAALMHLRRRKPQATVSVEDLLPTFSEEGHAYDDVPTPWAQSAEQLATRAETRAQVRAAIDGMPEIYRSVVLLRDIEELSTQETAELLGVSESVVKTRLHRARQALRTTLDRTLGVGSSPGGTP